MKIISSNRVAFVHENRETSYSQFIDYINFYSTILKAKKGTKIGILMENRPEWLFSFYAILNNNCIVVPIDYMGSEDDFSHIVKNSGAEILIHSDKTAELAASSEIDKINVDKIDNKDIVKSNEKYKKFDSTSDDTAIIMYTSGTSGKPIGVMLSNKNFFSNVKDAQLTKMFGKDEVCYTFAPMFHSAGMFATVFFCIHSQYKIILSDNISSEFILDTLQKHKVTLFLIVPRFAYLLHRKLMININSNKVTKYLFKLSRSIDNLRVSKLLFKKIFNKFGGHLKCILCGGSSLDSQVQRDLSALSLKINMCYGMTETAALSTLAVNGSIKYGSSGQIIKSAKIKILNGEVLIKGPNISKGYFNNKKATNERFKNGWLHSGDIGYVDEDNHLFITGRKKEIIALPNGKNVWPGEIEDELSKNPIFEEVAIIENRGKLTLLAKAAIDFAKTKGIVSIESYIKDILSDYNIKLPNYKKIISVKITSLKFPRTRIGKLQRYLLKDIISNQNNKKVDEEEPTNEEYKILKRYFKKNFNKDISPNDHIELDLSLSSIDKVDMLNFVKETFGFEMKIDDLSSNNSPLLISQHISKNKKKIEEKDVDWTKELNANIEYSPPKISSFIYRTMKLLFHTSLKTRVFGIENIPEGPAMLVANHVSIIDWSAITSVLGHHHKNTYCLGKDKFLSGPIIRPISTGAGIVVFNLDKEPKLALQKLANILEQGNKAALFPEGTRSRTGELLEFKKSFAILAKEKKVPVIPICLKGIDKVLPPGKKFPKLGVKIEIHFLKPIPTDKLSYEEITKKSRDAIAKELKKEML